MSDTQKTIEAYIEEMRRFHAAATPPPIDEPFVSPAVEAPPADVPVIDPADDPTVDDTPDGPVVLPPLNQPPTPTVPVYIPAKDFRREYWNPTAAETGTGFLQIRVSSGRDALPIEGARVVVSRPEETDNGNRLVLVTDVDGMTSFIALPTVDKSLSQSPGVKEPFSTYSIRTEAPDQLTVINLHVPIFDGVSSIQRVDMVAPEENYSGDGLVIFDEQVVPRLNEE